MVVGPEIQKISNFLTVAYRESRNLENFWIAPKLGKFQTFGLLQGGGMQKNRNLESGKSEMQKFQKSRK